MRLLCFNKLDLILRRPPTGRANARPMTGSVAVSKDGLQYRFVIPGTRSNPAGQKNSVEFVGPADPRSTSGRVRRPLGRRLEARQRNLQGETMKLYYSTNLNPRVAVAVARHLQSPVKYVLASPRHPGHASVRAGPGRDSGRARLAGPRPAVLRGLQGGLGLALRRAAQLPVGGYRNIARWHDRLNELDAWRAPFAGLDDGEAPQAAAGGSR